jgi:hypothetical protein
LGEHMHEAGVVLTAGRKSLIGTDPGAEVE